jgi:protein-disulfide isomerase
MEEEKKEHEHEQIHEHHKKNMTEKVRENPWVLATLICGVLIIALLIFSMGGFSGNVSAKTASEKLLGFYQSVGVQNLTIDSVKEVSGLYQVNLDYKGQTIPIYVTKDGKDLIPESSMTALDATSSSSSNTTSTTVPKSDKPKVELYVFAYCPYGTQMEKAIIPAVKLLGSNIDFSIRYIGDMHDKSGCTGTACFEKTETERQLCIEKNYPDKYLDYISAFVSSSAIGACSGDATCLAPLTSSIFSTLGIDANTISSCMTSDNLAMYNAEVSNANSVGVSGSPTIFVNGVEAQASTRSSEAVKGTICSAFNNVPSACSTKLDTTQASPGFGSSSSSSASSSSASCN